MVDEVEAPQKGAARAKRDRVPPRPVVQVASGLRRLLLRVADRLLPAHIPVVEHAHAFASRIFWLPWQNSAWPITSRTVRRLLTSWLV